MLYKITAHAYMIMCPGEIGITDMFSLDDILAMNIESGFVSRSPWARFLTGEPGWAQSAM